MGSVAQTIRSNREREARQQIEAGSFGTEPEIARGIPASNDAALAAHLQETREKNVEYLRLQTEDARQHYIDAAADNFRRTQYQQQAGKERAAIEKGQQSAADAVEAERVMSELAALAADPEVANKNPWTAPLDKLRDTANTLQKADRLQSLSPQPQQQTRAEAFPDGQAVHVTQNQDGTMTVEYATGEKFTGDPLTVTQEIGKAHVSTKLWARQRAQQAQPVNQPTEQVQTPQPTQEPTQHNSIADYWAAEQADALARQFGFSGKNEMLAWGENVTQKMPVIAQYEDERLAMDFSQRCPDFPATPEAADALVGIVKANGWQYNADSLQAAHLLAVQNHVYQPLSPEAIQTANGNAPQVNRQAAPPMLRGNSADLSQGAANPYEIPLSQLRAAAIQQELNRNSPGYR